MAEVNINLKCDLQHAVKVQYLDGNLFSQDAAANTINIEVTDNGAPATIGGTVSANVIRPDGGTVAVTGGTISGNIVSITLPAACYALVGMITIVVKLTDESTVTTLAAAVAYVYQSSTDTVVDPGTIIPSIEDLIDAIDTAVASIPADYSSLWTKLAPTFSSSTAYTAGQYVTYNSGLYRFTKAHAAGSWASGDVVAVNIGGELSDVKSAFEYFVETGEIYKLNHANIIPDPTMSGGQWQTDGISLSIVDIPDSLSKGCLVERTGSSSGKLGVYIPLSDLVDGTTYLISIREIASGTANLSIRSNNGTFAGFLNWKVTEQNMTKTGDLNTYEWTYNSSDFSSSEIGLSLYFKITINPGSTQTYYEPFMGDKAGDTQYAINEEADWALVSEVIEPTNIFNGEYLANSYFNSYGAIASANNYQCSKPALFKEGSYVYINNKQYFGSTADKVFKFTNKTDTTASEILSATLLQEVTRKTGNNTITYGIYTITITADSILGFNIGMSSYDDADYFMIVKGNTLAEYPESYLAYFEPYTGIENGILMNSAMLAQINPISGKKIVLDGDSICIGYGASGGYGKIIASHNNMVYKNYAESGGTITYGTIFDGGANRHWVSSAVDDYETDADYYIFEGGVNDVANNVTLGTLSTSYDPANFDRTTFIGALEYICCKLETLYPGKKYGFVFVHGIFNDSNYFPDWHSAYKPAMLNVFKKWGMPYIDLESEVPPLNQIASLKAIYTNSGDGWHPNALGYNTFYVDKITEWLKTL